ncbi:MAG: FGGY-family carbohydrate kinase, partial [Bacillota bacterium]
VRGGCGTTMDRRRKLCTVGIDVGTTHIKAVIFDEAGIEVARSVVNTPSHADGAGQVVWDPEAIWVKVAEAARGAIQALNACPAVGTSGSTPEIVGVAVASVGESGVALDREGRPLYPIIAWFDPRTAPQARWWSEKIGQVRTVAITGLSVKTIYSALKVLWMFEHVDGLREAIDTWLPVSGFVSFRLTGARAVDFSQASRTLLFDQAKLAWSQELLAASGIPSRILPELVPSGTLVGRVTAEASRRTGIPAGVPVFAGGHDHVCGALAVGATRPGAVLDSCGTAESILTSCPDAAVLGAVCENGFSFGHHVVEGMHYAMGGLLASGGAVEWFMREFCGSSPSYERVVDLAKKSRPGAGGVVFVPRLLGSGPPTRDERATGAFARIRPSATLADFARAVFEGLCFELKTAISAMETAIGQRVSSVIATGGGARNDLWLSIKASVLGLPVEVPQVTEASALGAALLAGIGAGFYRNAEDALAKTLRIGRRVFPEESLRETYEDAYTVYITVSDALRRADANS